MRAHHGDVVRVKCVLASLPANINGKKQRPNSATGLCIFDVLCIFDALNNPPSLPALYTMCIKVCDTQRRHGLALHLGRSRERGSDREKIPATRLAAKNSVKTF